MRITTCRATREERLRRMPGDLLVPDPVVSLTHAIDVAAPPERVWPWLAQMGAGRAGWYSWDRVDNGGRRSADVLVPELRRLAAGDLLPATPGARDAFFVVRAEPPRDLVLRWPAKAGSAGSRGSWEFRLEDEPGGSRLVVRARLSRLALAPANTEAEHASPVARLEAALLRLPPRLVRVAAVFGHRIMQARQLRGIKRRVERGRPG